MVVTSLLTVATSFASGPGQPAQAETAPSHPVQSVAEFPHRHYASLAEHFRAVNTTNDGKLTRSQATTAEWTRVVRHFDEIDVDHAGFVTLDEIHAYNISHRHRSKGADA